MPISTPKFKPYSKEKRQRYGTDWEKCRIAYLSEHPLCEVCEKQGRIEAATVVDHIIPIQQDPSKRLDHSNLQALCKPHHDISAQCKDKAGYMPDVGLDGLPVDQKHPFFTGGQ